ncbi:hypothetical protein P7K49_017123 [Saguinus oedipus]|uniref:Uncharacterized protein n=1 Tax=Saguinus oedipus TaxID=9490 RepID=A0ABQ9V4B0_SAGOE|nr:hypothetical protein P7K49_017123 [Saguinus oedipus]
MGASTPQPCPVYTNVTNMLSCVADVYANSPHTTLTLCLQWPYCPQSDMLGGENEGAEGTNPLQMRAASVEVPPSRALWWRSSIVTALSGNPAPGQRYSGKLTLEPQARSHFQLLPACEDSQRNVSKTQHLKTCTLLQAAFLYFEFPPADDGPSLNPHPELGAFQAHLEQVMTSSQPMAGPSFPLAGD